MIHFAMPAERSRPAPLLLPPLSLAGYLKLRRKAAGLSVDAVAQRISANNQSEARALVCLLETEGTKACYRETIDAFADAFPIDADVYLQLRDTPADQHPRICRGCGCSEWDPCVAGDGSHSCAWHGVATCTRCVGEPAVPVHQ
ncbi:hypothetical protein EQZ23_09900 [Sphingomonas sp. UV9]|uniref:hypothetical protein n=1 Tax=Sphingomonas sp. UV9 TaxID=1851410 RepID=UPI000FFC4562|nr:hypothetical protein [Sphingomonas sp. UV9]RXD05382.1 hypothetical protein EQZ23_09900 [Sphingomonas sp. UV9]